MPHATSTSGVEFRSRAADLAIKDMSGHCDRTFRTDCAYSSYEAQLTLALERHQCAYLHRAAPISPSDLFSQFLET